jgi:D-alanyl-D-alanine-carboxypeptidase/D-alanyl-D-alanine-endopeptidase
MLLAACSPIPSVPPQPSIQAMPTAPATADLPTPTRIESPTATQVADTPTATPPPALPIFSDDEIQAQVKRVAAGFIGGGKNPGLSVALVKRDPQTRQLQAMLLDFGSTAKGGGVPVDSNTVYEIGSITKVFTGILLAQAVGAGRMKLGDPIDSYLPSGVHAPVYQGFPITIAELATHRAGLPRDLASDSLTDLYNWLNGFQLSRKPGSEYIYSNLGYALLGDILARNAGTDYATLVLGSVSHPLGLMDTTEMLSADQASRLAQGYSYDGSLARYFPDTGAMSSAGYLHSTLADMTRFLIENMQPDSTPLAASLTLAQTLQSEGRNPGTGTGLGWEIEQLGKADERLWKGGVTPGFSSYIVFTSDRNSGLVLLSNGQYVDSLVPYLLPLLKQSTN